MQVAGHNAPYKFLPSPGATTWPVGPIPADTTFQVAAGDGNGIAFGYLVRMP